MFTHWSAWTCCVDGRRLLRLQNRLEMMASTRDEFNSESGSNVFSPFSLKDSMMFQMSTRDTKIKQEWNNQDLTEISIKNFLNGWQLDIKTQLQPIYLQQIHFYSGISFIFLYLIYMQFMYLSDVTNWIRVAHSLHYSMKCFCASKKFVMNLVWGILTFINY